MLFYRNRANKQKPGAKTMSKLTQSLKTSVAYHTEQADANIEQIRLAFLSTEFMLARLQLEGLMPKEVNKNV